MESDPRIAPLYGASELSLSIPQHELLRDCLASGLERARDALADTAAASSELRLDSVSTCTLYDFDPDRDPRGPSGELIAGVLQRFEGPLCGTGLFALDPGDALLWLQAGEGQGEPLDRFVDQGRRLLEVVVGALADAAGADALPGAPALEERPLMAVLLGTHAPSDTLVLGLSGELVFPVADVPEIRAPFRVLLLLEPKLVAGILAGLPRDEESASS